ncbi:hypothetical protein [Frigoribacterium sp. CFBP 13707]|uniref:hypothetical protein n=1 Tax=Frigoribacterium sp. CFBP 13707 TaxID=2775313 RepID=UPI0017802001|nr:hypothetical protein [Frigoribacterium sp. CFBP 13707]MBD8728260.1 hypothetical protein [Frigoribacterium sp. CFBP 13707]
MDVPPELIGVGVRLTETAARNGASFIQDRITQLRASGEQSKVIAGLEEIIQSLMSDKNDLTRIAQTYQAELVSQQLNAGDVQYIASTIIPILESFAGPATSDGEGGEPVVENSMRKNIETLRPLLSAETVNILQLLGFNFRRAIGEPLTKLSESAILSNVNNSEAVRLESLKREQLYMQVALDEGAFERFRAMVGS